MPERAGYELEPVETLIDKIRAYNKNSDAELIRAAYNFGREAHEGQLRKSGEPYFTHPIAVANLLTEVRIDDASIVTALLHDTVEDTEATEADVIELFGEEVAQLVDGVTKLTNLELGSVQHAQSENLRKLLIAMSKDVRVLLVKLADRLHNMRTIKSMAPDKQRKKARETMDIYAPMAGRMGMQYLRDELEDLSFQILNPVARESIIRRFIKMRNENGDVVPKIITDIETELYNWRIPSTVTGREKKPYSVWRKIQQKGEGFQRLSDIYGFRIVTNNIEDCYRALGAVHRRWTAVPGRFKDYISQPKQNGYRSIHTTVSGRDGKRVEIQIRTKDMHVVAESGVAAHWSYKDGMRVHNPYAVDPFRWVESLQDHFDDDDPEEFLENVKLDMYAEQVFVFSPKGEVINLPRGATPLDFAYSIHTSLGNATIGAIVDGKRVPLSTKLRNGQTIHILQVEGQKPQVAWLDMVKTGRAKAAIKRALKAEEAAHNIALGREVARAAFERVEKTYSEKGITLAATNLNFANANELLEALGTGEITGRKLINALYPELSDKQDTQRNVSIMVQPHIGATPAYASRPGQCCYPVPGDRIVGIARKGHGLIYHAIDCPALLVYDTVEDDEEKWRWVDLHWPPEASEAPVNPTRIITIISNDAGVLGKVCTLIGENHSNIDDLDFVERNPDFYKVAFEIEVRDLTHLHNITTALLADKDVTEIYRDQDPLRDEFYREKVNREASETL